MTSEAASPQGGAPLGEPFAQVPRLAYIDNVRSVIIILVISMHAADTYSPFGNWYFGDKAGTSRGLAMAFGTYQSFLQAFFMATLFTIAGYFAQAALERRSRARFVKDRLFRLGVPLLTYMFFVGPLTEFFVAGSWQSSPPRSFAGDWIHHLADGELLDESGPLWFCLALLLFSLVFAVAAPVRSTGRRCADPFPPLRRLVAFVGLMAVATFIVRLGFAEGSSFLNLQLADFAQYILMFAAGIAGRRRGWLRGLPSSQAAGWLLGGLVLGLAVWVLLIGLGGALQGKLDAYRGGWHWQAAAKCLWESFVCVAMSVGVLGLFRAKLFGHGAVWRFLSVNAFAAYVFHPPLLILATRVLALWDGSAALKFLLATLAGTILSFGFGGLVLRRVPVVRDVFA